MAKEHTESAVRDPELFARPVVNISVTANHNVHSGWRSTIAVLREGEGWNKGRKDYYGQLSRAELLDVLTSALARILEDPTD